VSVLVVDASVAAKWYLEEAHTDAARRALSPDHELHVPDFFFLEMDSVFCKHLRRGDISAQHAADSRAAVRRVPMQVWPFGQLQEAAYSTANRARLSIYDCLYVALAALVGGQVVTADSSLRRAVADGPLADHVLWVEDVA
jgi:predicted nucleic acid-binding protein